MASVAHLSAAYIQVNPALQARANCRYNGVSIVPLYSAAAAMNMQESDPSNQTGTESNGVASGRSSKLMSVLFVGRKKTGEPIQAILQRTPNESSREAFEFVLVTNQRDALREIRSDPPKVVLVEVDMRPDSRARFGEMIRYRLPAAQILAVGKNEPQGSFEFDDFIPVPIEPDVLDALMHRLRLNAASYVIEEGVIRLNLAKRTVHTPNGRHHMTPKQCALLQMLMMSPGEVVRRRDIMAAIWDTSYLDDTRTLDVHIRWLRECIEPDPSNPQYLITVRGKGYVLYTHDGPEHNKPPAQ